MYCRLCGKNGAKATQDELCSKCWREHKVCTICGGLYLKKEVKSGLCYMCREDRAAIYGEGED